MPKRNLKKLLQKYLPKTYAVKLNDGVENTVAGMYLMLLNAKGGCVGLRKGIFLVGEGIVKVLDENKVGYKKFKARPGRVDDVYKEAERRGWFK